jgi:hypothetical protein
MDMRRTTVFLAATVTACSMYADYLVSNEGLWPKSWPKGLEPLRKQARTLEGPEVLTRHYEIPFTKREEFEAAWPHLLKIKSKGAPIFLVHAPQTNFFQVKPAGVLIHAPPIDTDKQANPEEPLAGPGWQDAARLRGRWTWTTFIELVVDGHIVDLNRIPLPADTPIIDERFRKRENQRSGQ